MDLALRDRWLMSQQDQSISEAIARDKPRLRNFIRRRVPDPRDAEDILQDVFYELVEANRLLMPINHITGWLFRVARNRIIDLFRKKRPESFSDTTIADENGETLHIEDLLPARAHRAALGGGAIEISGSIEGNTIRG
jgi:RNA polymerase sigma factor (sigma-70 family)